MKHLFWFGGRLFGAKRKVNSLALFLLLFSGPVYAQGPQAYGPFVVELSILWLPDYLDAALLSHGYINHMAGPDAYSLVHEKNRRRVDLLKDFYELASTFLHQNFKGTSVMKKGDTFFETRLKRSGRIQFKPGGDKIFDLPGKPPRMAVTGTALDSKVIFNLGLISDAKTFSFGEALGLWLHELGHKLPEGKYTQEEIDSAAGMIARWYGPQMQIQTIAGRDFLILNPVPFSKEGDAWAGPFAGTPQRRSPVFAVLQGDKFTDLAPALNAELDRFAHPLSNKLEVKRAILSAIKLKENAGDIEMRLELRTSRLPKNMSHYVMDEIGPNYHKSARLVLSRDLKSLSVTHYKDEPLPRPLIMDAEAELEAPAVSTDRKELKFTLKLHLQNQTHFHAAGYPDAYFTIMALLDGEPVRLEGKIRYKLTTLGTGMPAEVYKKPFTKEGRVTVGIGELEGRELELIGIQDRFFTLGRGWEPPEEEQKRVRVLEPLIVELPGCAPELKP